MCRPCPDINHITSKQPALDISYCVCKAGWRKTTDNKCEGILLKNPNSVLESKAKFFRISTLYKF